MLREIDIKKKHSDNDFIKSLPSHPGKEFEIKKRLDKLRGINNSSNNNNSNNNNNNNNNINNSNLFGLGPGGDPPILPRIEDFLDNSRPPPQPPSIKLGENLFKSETPPLFPSLANEFDVNAKIRAPPPNISTCGIGNDLFGSQAASAIRENKTKTHKEVDDFLYELPEKMPDLELGDELVNTLGTEAQSLFDKDSLTKKEEEDEVLKNLMEEYDIENIRDTMDETAQVPESIYFFYGGDSDEFVKALEFIGLSPINREFSAFLLSDLGRKTITENKLSIHVESGDIFYDNHNTGEKFYSFLLSQQNDEAAYIPKKSSYKNSFETYIDSFLQSFSIDDQEKFNLLAFKNSKYLFYHFNDFIKAHGNPRYRLLHTRKMLDSVGIKKIEEKNKQFLIEKIIHGIEFENLYATNSERKPEIMSTIGRNYRIA